MTSIASRSTRSVSQSLAIIADAWFSGEPHEPAVIDTYARRRPRLKIRQARARPPDTRIPEQARPRNGKRRRRARPARPPSDLLWQLRLAFVRSRILADCTACRPLPRVARSDGNPRVDRRPFHRYQRRRRSRVFAAAGSARFRTSIRLGVAARARRTASVDAIARRPTLGRGAGAACARVCRAFQGIPAEVDISAACGHAFQYGVRLDAGYRLCAAGG